jgi:hypothetical protein
MSNWRSSAARFAPTRLVTILLSHVLLAAGLSQSLAQAQLDAGSIDGVYFQIRGLDVSGNPIDKLISRFGFTCVPELRYLGRPCRVEKEVAAFVNSLPHNRKEMTEALTTLGATCVRDSARAVDCIYRKRTRNFGWITGEPTPRTIMDDIFLFHVTAEHDDEPFEAKVQFSRISEKIK